MISRIWHGGTTPENADAYEKLLRHEIIEGFIDRKIEGFRRMHIRTRAESQNLFFSYPVRQSSSGNRDYCVGHIDHTA